MNHKLITLCTIVPTFLALTGTGLGLWVFRENIAEKNIKISMEVEPALVTSNFKAEWVSKKLTLDDSHKYMSGMIIKLSVDLEYLKGYLKTSDSSGEITSADVNGNINLSLNYTVSCTISKRESTLPCLNEFIKMTKVEEIIEGSENVVNDQYEENDLNDLQKEPILIWQNPSHSILLHPHKHKRFLQSAHISATSKKRATPKNTPI